MPATRRAQVLMEPDEYDALERIAARRGVSVASLFREAVRERFLGQAAERMAAAEAIAGMGLPVDTWERLAADIEEAYGDGLP